jgi:regulatory protein
MTDTELNPPVTSANVRMAAMNLLSLREHSAKELQVKLAKKFVSVDLVSGVIQKLQDDGLQSDERFTEAFVNMRLRQGKGALVIRMELKEKGIGSDLIAKYIASVENTVNWNQMALKAYEKKYGKDPISDLKEKAKRIRFLNARGFSSANIQYVFKCITSDTDEHQF